MSRVRSMLAQSVRAAAPGLFWRRRIRLMRTSDYEPELRFVPVLCDPRRLGIDVGASGGVYSVNVTGCGAQCVAFEPRPFHARELREMAAAASLPLRVEQVALSDREGEANLRVLTEDPGRSSIEAENRLEDEDGSPCETITVQARTMDSYGFSPVGFIASES